MSVLAETVSLDGDAIAIILGVLVVILVAGVALFVAAFVFAYRSGQGRYPPDRWYSLVALQVLLAAASFRSITGPVLIGLALVGQFVLHTIGREKR